jgi:hypothetical protein
VGICARLSGADKNAIFVLVTWHRHLCYQDFRKTAIVISAGGTGNPKPFERLLSSKICTFFNFFQIFSGFIINILVPGIACTIEALEQAQSGLDSVSKERVRGTWLRQLLGADSWRSVFDCGSLSILFANAAGGRCTQTTEEPPAANVDLRFVIRGWYASAMGVIGRFLLTVMCRNV